MTFCPNILVEEKCVSLFTISGIIRQHTILLDKFCQINDSSFKSIDDLKNICTKPTPSTQQSPDDQDDSCEEEADEMADEMANAVPEGPNCATRQKDI